MQSYRLTGHNVIQLIYPIRHKKKNVYTEPIPELLKELDWEEIYSSHNEHQETKQTHNRNVPFLFPDTYDTQYRKNLRRWIQDKQFFSYFHPSVQWNLFHDTNKKFRAFRLKKPNRTKYIAEFSAYGNAQENLPFIQFEWISSEIYTFSDDNAFLVVRVSLLENIEVIEEEKRFKTIVHPTPFQRLDIWAKFVNRIRQNYEKYEGQPKLTIYLETKMKTNGLFFDIITNTLPFGHHLHMSNLEATTIMNNETQDEVSYRTEANTFTHAFVQADLSEDLTKNELYQLIHIDDEDGESGGTPPFREKFVNEHIYDRWASTKTYYTAIDYGAVTITDSKQTFYKEHTYKETYDTNQKGVDFPDLLYQHHCRQYLIFILLQLYYREELQEIMGRYARIPNLNTRKNRETARRVLDTYYNLNQFFFFDRITHEIQGLEIWSFYQKVFKTKELYSAVQQDMNELNQRLIEKISGDQQKELGILTILTAITGMFGMNLIIEDFFKVPNKDVMNVLSIFPVFGDRWSAIIKMGINVLVLFSIASILVIVVIRFFKGSSSTCKRVFQNVKRYLRNV